jgi:hypothetical protein
MSDWDDWKEKQTPVYTFPLRIRQIRELHGKRDDKICKNCIHCIAAGKNRTFYKCDMSKITRGAATDWRVHWPACGLYEEPKP